MIFTLPGPMHVSDSVVVVVAISEYSTIKFKHQASIGARCLSGSCLTWQVMKNQVKDLMIRDLVLVPG